MKKLDYNLPWVDMLTLIHENYTIIEKSVFECLNAGCVCIWIVCDRSITPLMKERVGEWAYNPTNSYKSFIPVRYNSKRVDKCLKHVPIYYIPLRLEDTFERYTKNSVGWSVIHGFTMANYVTKRLTSHLIPDKFYVCFPYGMYDCRETRIRKEQQITRSENVFYTFKGKSVMDKEYLPFYCSNQYTEDIMKFMKRRSINLRISNPLRTDIDDNLYDISTILKGSITMPEVLTGKKKFIELKNYKRIDTWEGYVDYMRSDLIENCFVPTNKKKYLNVENRSKVRSKVFEFDEQKAREIEESERILKRAENKNPGNNDWKEWEGEDDDDE